MGGVEDGERALGLADEAYARFDVEAAVAHLSAAVRALTAANEPRRAAMACLRLGDALAYGLGNTTAARAWFGRAARLLADEPPCVEQGWVAVAAMGCDVGDPAELLAGAELALSRAREFGDVNLEAKALADGGLAHVQAGRVAEGMALLEEAMALACGPADDDDVAGRSACSFFTACYYTADFERAGSWADLMRQRGLIGPRSGVGARPGAAGDGGREGADAALAPAQAFLSSHCDSVHATLLCELGRWGDAEAVLTRSMAEFEAVVRAPSWHPAIVLADLRIRQGRLADAEALLLGKDQAFEALLPAARLHLARGDHDLARAAAQRGLRALGGDQLRAVELLTVLVDAELARGDLDAARDACSALTERTGDHAVAGLRGRTAAARARLLAAGGDLPGAIAELEAAVDRLDGGRVPWRRTTLLLDLAGLRERAGDVLGATMDAKAAAAALASLDVVLAPRHADLLERLGVGPGPGGAAATTTAELVRDGTWWVASHAGTHVRLRDTKGLRYLAVLLASPGVERHALDLVDRVEGVEPAGSAGSAGSASVSRRSLGDAGPLLDARARTAFRHRIEQLRAVCDEALAAGRDDEAEAAQAELDQLVSRLAQAFGLGGRERRAASAAERARLNVTRALRAATARLSEALPGEAGAALDRRVRTGLYCAYDDTGDPERDRVRWVVRP